MNETTIHFLTIEQAIADFSTFVVALKQRYKTESSPVIAFGGSYGGVLSLFARLKQPNVFAGALASSAPPLKKKLRSSNDFNVIVTQAYGNVSSHCPNIVRGAWKELQQLSTSSNGRAKIAVDLQLCSVPQSAEQAMSLYGWLTAALETMVQYGYPYPTHFDNPVPAFPFKVTCLAMLQSKQHHVSNLRAIRAAAQTYYNYTGQAGKCFAVDLNKNYNSKQLQTFVGASLSAWGYQTCTEVFQPIPSNGITDFYLPYTPNYQEIVSCF